MMISPVTPDKQHKNKSPQLDSNELLFYLGKATRPLNSVTTDVDITITESGK
jgi:hypothetical protein